MIQPGDYVLFNVQGKVWAGDREVVDSYTDWQPQGLPHGPRPPSRPGGGWPDSGSAAGS